MKTKISLIVIMMAVLYFCPHYVFGQNFSRVLELNARRMNGSDVEALQKRLLSFGFSGVGEADGYYGPKTEETIKTIQKFAGF